MSLFIGVLISLCFLQVAVALPHANLPYQNVEVRAGSKLVIPCDLTTDGVTGNEKIDFEWGFTPDGSDRYRTIMRRNDVKLHPGVPHELRVHLHPTHPIQEDCSLVINPLLMEDSGTYEIKVTVNGAQSGPIRRVIVYMEDSPLMTAGRKFSAKRKAMIQLQEPMAFAEEEKMAAVEEGQTTGKKDNARRIAMIHSPVNTFHAGNMPTVVHPEQKLTVEEKQAPAVEEGQARPVDNWKTTGKKYIAKLLGKFHSPEKTTTTDKQTPTAEKKQAPAVEEGQARPVDNWKTTGKKYIAIAKLLDKFHSPEKPTTDKQTPTAEEKQAPAVEKGQARPVDNWKTTGKKYIAKLLGKFHSPEKTTTTDKQTPTAEKKQVAAVEEGQARPVDNWKTTGKKYIAIAKLLDKFHSPEKPTTDKQTPTAEEKQAPAVEKGQARPVDNWKTTGKKYIAKLLGKFHSPEKTTTTDKQTPTAEKKQVAAVEEGQARPVDNWKTTGKKYIAIAKLLDKFHSPEKPTTDKQTPTAEEKQAPAVEKGQARPVDNWKTTGKKYIAKLLGKFRSPEKTTTDKQTPTAEEKQAPAVEEGQARSVDNWKTTGKKYIAIAKLLDKFHSPEKTTTTDKQTPTAEKKQAPAVEKGQASPVDKEQTELVDEGLTTGKKRNARHKATVHHPVNKYDALGSEMVSLIKEALTMAEKEINSKQYNTRRKAWPKPTPTVHSPVTTTIQTTTVDKTPMGLVKRIIKNLKKYAILLGIGLVSVIITFVMALFIFGCAAKRCLDRQEESSLEEGRGYKVTTSSNMSPCHCCRCGGVVHVFKVCAAGVCAVAAPVVTACAFAARVVAACARAAYAVVARAVEAYKYLRHMI